MNLFNVTNPNIFLDKLEDSIARIRKGFLKIFLMLLLLFLGQHLAQSNDIRFTHYTTEDGLSLSTANIIFQDSRGFIWFGTYNGLNRFDGYEFKIYMPEPKNTNSISDYFISTIAEDIEGNVWVGTEDGLNRYDWKTDKFYRYKHDPKNPKSISTNIIRHIFKDSKGELWIATSVGLCRYNKKEDNFIAYYAIDGDLISISCDDVIAATDDNEGNVWFGTWAGLNKYDRTKNQFEQFWAEEGNSQTISSDEVTAVCVFNDILWIGTNGKGIDCFNLKTGKFTHHTSTPANPSTLSDDYITSIYKDSRNNLWITTRNGLNKFDFKTNRFIRYYHDSTKPNSLRNNEIYTIAEDKTGLIWLGTSGAVSKFSPPINFFNNYQINAPEPGKSLHNNSVTAICEDRNGNIWLGTQDGIEILDSFKKSIKHFSVDKNNKNSLNNNNILTIIEDRAGIIWIGTDGGGLNKYDPQTGAFTYFKQVALDSTTLSNNGVTSICEDKNGFLWIGTWWGLNKFDKKTGKVIERYFLDLNKPDALKNDNIWVILEDKLGTIWVGTDGGGLSKYDPVKKSFTNYLYDMSNVEDMAGKRVVALFESGNGILWVGTTQGLYSYDRKTGSFTEFFVDAGIAGRIIAGITEDSKGNLWISTNKGISKYEPDKKRFRNYSKRHGLLGGDFFQNSVLKSKTGEMFFGNAHRLTYFQPENIKDISIQTTVIISDFKIYNQSVPIGDNSILKQSITSCDEIKIPYGLGMLTFEFALMDYFDVNRNIFDYKLEGLDDDWNHVGNRNHATYTNLPPGEYVLKVSAYNNEGVETPAETSLRIIVTAPFYMTSWFRILVAVGIILIVLGVFQYRTITIKRQNRILEQKVADRTKDLDKSIEELNQEIIERRKAEEQVYNSLKEKEVLLKEIHHRVKNNLQVISSLLYLQSRTIKDEEMMNLFSDSQNRIKSMALIHEKLYQSENFARVNFKDYVSGLVTNLEQTYRKNGTPIAMNILIEDVYLNLDSAISCGLIINELITNAFKYAFPIDWLSKKTEPYDCKIEIRIDREEENKYRMSVHDNGIGMPEDFDIENSESLGLTLVKILTNQLNGVLEISGSNGAQFIIFFRDK